MPADRPPVERGREAALREALQQGYTTVDGLFCIKADILAAALVEPPPPAEPEGLDRESETYCHRCGGPNRVWYAPSPLWNEVMRGGDINGPWKWNEIICPTCFMVLAEDAGIARSWRLDARKVLVPLSLVTPSGRVWDVDQDLWVEPLPPADAGEGLARPGDVAAGLDAAWEEAEAAAEELTAGLGTISVRRWAWNTPEDFVANHRDTSETGPTPVAALGSLAAALRAARRSPE